ncbi:phosphate acetyltransferase [Lagierella sp.]|uniref:phosphate acetyltransferase n=1 Tax=Lagierella sp. TaxID=2849657 RepID=UPI002627820A|nr:phosphate acetyltransferase [Lagierella sp.]
MDIIKNVREQIEGKNINIVFPEGEDIRILKACTRLQEEGILHPIVLGNIVEINKTAADNGLNIENLEILDMENYPERDMLLEAFEERRKGKNTREECSEMLMIPNYFGTVLVHTGKAAGLVSGAVNSTGDTVRPALQIIKTKPGISRTSGAMLMLGPNEELYVFADIAINIELEAAQLAEVALCSAKTAKLFGLDPKVAMLSFSTKGSAKHDLATKMEEATKLAKELDKDLVVDGEMQFDAAISPVVAKKKAPDSNVAGQANVFVFPDLQAGNIGYKIAQRLGGYEAIGPILQGLNKPISDLSRGCVEEDVYKIALITAAQSLQ